MKLKYVHSYTDRHGKRRHYVRMDGKRYPLPNPGEMQVPSAAFLEKYREIVGERATRMKRSAVENRGRIYVAGFGDYVKIGFTTGSVQSRINGMSTGCPEDMAILVDMPGTRKDEGLLHKRFAAHRLRREWFRLDGELLTWVQEKQQPSVTNSARVSQSAVYKPLQ